MSRLDYCNSLLVGSPNSNSTDAESPNYLCMSHSESTTPSKPHSSPTATPLAPSFWTNKIQNCLPVLQRNHRFCSLLSFWATTPLQSFPVSLLFVRHTCSNTNAATAIRTAFAFFHTLAPTSGTISPKTSGTLLLSLPSKVNSRHFSSQTISAKQHHPSLLSVCTVCACVCVCVCVHLLHSYAWNLVYIMC